MYQLLSTFAGQVVLVGSNHDVDDDTDGERVGDKSQLPVDDRQEEEGGSDVQVISVQGGKKDVQINTIEKNGVVILK